jgi:hypothetical protein
MRAKIWGRDCETMTQLPAPFYVMPHGFADPNLLPMVLLARAMNLWRAKSVRRDHRASLSDFIDTVSKALFM